MFNLLGPLTSIKGFNILKILQERQEGTTSISLDHKIAIQVALLAFKTDL